MEDFFTWVSQLAREREAFALCIVTEKIGSGPVSVGDVMAVTVDRRRIGTLGGWSFEKLFLDRVIKMIREGRSGPIEVDISGREKGGLECGGKIKIFVSVFQPPPRIIIFGAGHIGTALAKISSIIGYDTILVEEKDVKPNADYKQIKIVESYREYAASMEGNKDTFIVITVGEVDPCVEILRELLKREYRYIGLLGSKRKVMRVKEELARSGVPENRIATVRGPAGLKIGARKPGEIAISIMAEIIKTSNEQASHIPPQ